MADPATLGALAAIVAMALATYACRLGGVLIMRRIRPSPVVERALTALPGAIVAATVVPIALRAGPAAIAGIVVGIAVTRTTGRDLAGLVCGLVTAALWRALISA